ncbi:MAG: hypothetical protein JWN44_4559 [Myxococcales bacterium]|nr:hypothetical protein [Myxococcales bacterium]
MRRGFDNGSLANRAALVAGVVVVAGAGILLVTQLGTLRRYIRMRVMAGRRHPTPPNTERAGDRTPPRWGTSHWPVH